jgi:nicotinate-nucleotide pyrophosphorylase (carboxylating)
MNQASLHQLIESALQEDIGEGDHSTLACISATARGKAVLKIKEAGIIAGIEVAKKIFQFKDPAVTFTAQLQDGDQMVAGEIAFEVESYVPTILQCERLVLNCMQRMSGIATLTHRYVQKLIGYSTKILDTRKTTPNFRLLEKEAVRIGGGINHRFGLYDMIMLKDNHIDFCGDIEKAIEKTWHYVQAVKPELRIEVEARSLEDVKKIISVGRGKVFRILLDNFTPQALAQAVSMLKMEGGFETEASGGINLENIESYAQSGVDYVSVGALIHQARSVDLSLKAVNF